MDIDRFFIIANRDKDKKQDFCRNICSFLEKHEKTCRVACSDEERMDIRKSLRSEGDCILALGGDGTVLEAAHIAAGTDVPVLGINIGNMGYLAEIKSGSWEQSLLRVVEGDCYVEDRMMLSGCITDGKSRMYPGAAGQALNDIVITRSGALRAIHYNVYIDGKFLNRFSADGVILATATGSTAYNMSAGGPIVEPTARLILLTPICSHTLNNRSIVLSANDRVTIEMILPQGREPVSAQCYFDGTASRELISGDRVDINSSLEKTRLLRLSRKGFLETLHRKFTATTTFPS